MLISVIIPTLNESDSVPILCERMISVQENLKLKGMKLEILFVDDGSVDGTPDRIQKISNEAKLNIQLIQRNERGLAQAVLQGFQMAKGDIWGAMDSDLSHPPEIIPDLIQKLEDSDCVIGSRHLPGGGVEEWPWLRKFSSQAAAFLAKPLLKGITDPMSGFFFIKKSVLEGVPLNPLGYKILLEILVKGNYDTVIEVPYIFRNRGLGKSKMDRKVIQDYFIHLLKLYLWKIHH